MILTSCRIAALGTLAAIAMASAFALTACDDAPPQQAQPAPGSAAPAATPKLATISKDMVAAVSTGKTATAIGVHFALGALPVAGKALPVDIVIVPHREFSSVRAHFEGPDGIAVTVGDDFGPITGAEPETSLKHQLVLLPAREGVFMVSIGVDTESDEGNITRVFSMPVIVSLSESTGSAPAPAETPNPAPAPPGAN